MRESRRLQPPTAVPIRDARISRRHLRCRRRRGGRRHGRRGGVACTAGGGVMRSSWAGRRARDPCRATRPPPAVRRRGDARGARARVCGAGGGAVRRGRGRRQRRLRMRLRMPSLAGGCRSHSGGHRASHRRSRVMVATVTVVRVLGCVTRCAPYSAPLRPCPAPPRRCFSPASAARRRWRRRRRGFELLAVVTEQETR